MATSDRTALSMRRLKLGLSIGAVVSCLLAGVVYAGSGGLQLLQDGDLIRGRQTPKPRWKCVGQCTEVKSSVCKPLPPPNQPVFCQALTVGQICGYKIDEIAAGNDCVQSPSGALDTCDTDGAVKCYKKFECICQPLAGTPPTSKCDSQGASQWQDEKSCSTANCTTGDCVKNIQ
jgi:hypothetical protein